MDKAQELKMHLVKEFGSIDEKKSVDFCREAYKFLTEGEQNDTPSAAPAVSSEEAIAVDMGLPSGTLWCDRNVGAKSPEDYGAFFSWGNTDPHYPNRDNMDWGDDDDGFDYSFDSDTYETQLETTIDEVLDISVPVLVDRRGYSSRSRNDTACHNRKRNHRRYPAHICEPKVPQKPVHRCYPL